MELASAHPSQGTQPRSEFCVIGAGMLLALDFWIISLTPWWGPPVPLKPILCRTRLHQQWPDYYRTFTTYIKTGFNSTVLFILIKKKTSLRQKHNWAINYTYKTLQITQKMCSYRYNYNITKAGNLFLGVLWDIYTSVLWKQRTSSTRTDVSWATLKDLAPHRSARWDPWSFCWAKCLTNVHTIHTGNRWSHGEGSEPLRCWSVSCVNTESGQGSTCGALQPENVPKWRLNCLFKEVWNVNKWVKNEQQSSYAF